MDDWKTDTSPSEGENIMLLPGGIDEMNLTDGESKALPRPLHP